MGLISWVRSRWYLSGEFDRPEIDAEFDGEAPVEPTVSLRFRVTTPEIPATADAPKREKVTYYVYGQTEEEAIARLDASLRVGATVEAAGHVVDGLLVLPDDERKPAIFDGRAAPGS